MATSAVSAGTIVVEVLNNRNYVDWSDLVRNYLLAQDLWDVVEEEEKEEEVDDQFKAWRKKNAMALHTIQVSCGPETFALIRGIKSAKSAWDILAEKFKAQPLLPSDLLESATSSNNPGYDEIVCDFNQYQPFFDAVRIGDWNKAKEFLTLHPNAVRARIPYSNQTALHIATEFEREHIVEELVQLMPKEDLEIQSFGWTALAIAANKGNIKMVECMVRQSKKILSIATEKNSTPILLACVNEHWDVLDYLYSVTPFEDLKPEKGPYGAGLLCHFIGAKKFDIAQELIQFCPQLVLTKGPYWLSPIQTLACMSSAFPSGAHLKFWQQWIYNCIHIEPTRAIRDIRVRLQNEGNEGSNPTHITWSGFLKGLISNLLELLGINRIREMKLIHIQALELLDRMCEVIKCSEENEKRGIDQAIFQAIERGIFEFVDRLLQTSPDLIGSFNQMKRTVFQFAIECRQEKVYSLIYRFDEKKRTVIGNVADSSRNSTLHMAGMLSPLAKLNKISGAALQMQRELQWFKEVETIVFPRVQEIFNEENMTPHDLFTKNHEQLVKEGERWMKETATSCTVVGALIITIMFASAFTVPGGNNGETGIPIFLKTKLFMAFIVSDAISLFSSTTSVLMFLGILTSRYAEEDFLKSLPTKMIIGLSTLFVSIAAMMVAFSSGLFIMIHEQSWIVIPMIFLASVPITLFIWMQFPLLVEIFISTYGRGIFDRKLKPWSTDIILDGTCT
ncbi:PREDICTED: uncharacterized protein LOC103334783 [Prunus mume]|uniref:Uncharacterized protein LOC103334783 n=1 Tax=Prunus mume TaxID=102107 RepID=A0ABM0P8R1_PRUMU|nr:PREDICTED: uncharacterized protein LOC103334783 [Prunus mume]